ncbi:MAG: SAM-dependent methyltransferase [Verrucomicrobiota bacterium]
MPLSLEKVVPWGRSLDEYRLMFSLSDSDLRKRIVGCGDGPASFNAEMSEIGNRVVSFDPLYRFSGEEIAARFEESVDLVINQVRASLDSWTWAYHRDPENLLLNRRRALRLFLNDFEKGKREERYELKELPTVEYADREFDLALCSHFLFLYSDHFSYEFHLSSILEMCRIAEEVRIFPVLTLKQGKSKYLEGIIDYLRGSGMSAEVRRVDYELQLNGNEALFIRQFD